MNLKRCYKLIFSTFVAAFIFCCYSCTAFAVFGDPISGAMAAAGAASGFSIGGFGGAAASATAGIVASGTTDPVSWGDLDRYGVVHHGDNDTVEITLSPDIATAGERRLENINQKYGLAPGSIHNLGSYYALGSYIFYQSAGTNAFRGASIGTVDAYNDITLFADQAQFSTVSQSNTTTRCYINIGNASNYSNYSKATINGWNVALKYYVNTGEFEFVRQGYSTTLTNKALPNNVTVDTRNTNISRSNDSAIIDPYGKANKVTIPDSYVQDISFTPDTTITDVSIIEAILQAIMEAWEDQAIEESIYVPTPVPPEPTPTPVPGQTIGDTPFTTLEEYLDSWTESFGDWTDDVFSGWTEVFGDIYDSVSDGVGAIVSVLEDILDAVLDIAEAIVNGDTELISGFLSPFFNAFKSWFDTIKQHISIWHYVVEWLSNIGSTFSFFFGIMSGTSYYFVLPIYAAFAGTVVIAIYRKFGR